MSSILPPENLRGAIRKLASTRTINAVATPVMSKMMLTRLGIGKYRAFAQRRVKLGVVGQQ